MDEEDIVPLAGGNDDAVLSDDEAANLIASTLDDDDDETEGGAGAPAGDEGEAGASQRAEGDEPDANTTADAADRNEEDGDDADVVLRDNTKVKLSELKRIAGDQAGEMQRHRVAMEAREAEVQTRVQRVAQQEKFFGEAVPAAIAIIQSVIPPHPSADLRDTDPIAYHNQKDAHFEGIQRLRAFQGAMTAQEQETAQQEAARQKQFIVNEQDKLMRAMPQFREEKSRTKFLGDMMKTGKEAGFSEAEINDISDHRIFKILDKAIKYDELMSNKPVAQKKAQTAVPVQSPGRRVTAAEAKAHSRSESFERLRKHGRDEDAAAVIANLL